MPPEQTSVGFLKADGSSLRVSAKQSTFIWTQIEKSDNAFRTFAAHAIATLLAVILLSVESPSKEEFVFYAKGIQEIQSYTFPGSATTRSQYVIVDSLDVNGFRHVELEQREPVIDTAVYTIGIDQTVYDRDDNGDLIKYFSFIDTIGTKYPLHPNSYRVYYGLDTINALGSERSSHKFGRFTVPMPEVDPEGSLTYYEYVCDSFGLVMMEDAHHGGVIYKVAAVIVDSVRIGDPPVSVNTESPLSQKRAPSSVSARMEGCTLAVQVLDGDYLIMIYNLQGKKVLDAGEARPNDGVIRLDLQRAGVCSPGPYLVTFSNLVSNEQFSVNILIDGY